MVVIQLKLLKEYYNGLELKAWNTSGFRSIEVEDSVYKNSFGFTPAYACSCPYDEYINVDPITSIKITVTNSENQEVIDVTDNFLTYAYDGEQLTISELFENRADWHDGFQMDMMEYDNIPNSSIFTVTIFLESGVELMERTQEIKFK